MKFCLSLLGLLFVLSCSSDDDQTTEDTINATDLQIPLTALVLDQEELLLYDFSSSEQPSLINLSQLHGIPANFSYINKSEGILNFAKRNNGDFDFWRYNLASDNSDSFGQFCELEAFESVVRTAVGANKYAVFSRIDDGETFLNYIHVFDSQSGNYQKSFYANGGLGPSSTVVYSDNEALVYLYGATGVELYKIDLSSQLVLEVATLGNDARLALDSENIHIFYDTGLYKKLSLSNFEETIVGTLNISLSNYSFGFLDAVITEQQMIVDLDYPQPSAFSSGPGIIDLNSGQVTAGGDFFLFDLREDLSASLGQDVFGFGTYLVDPVSFRIFVSYSTNEGNFGIVETNFQGEIVNTVSLPNNPIRLFYLEN